MPTEEQYNSLEQTVTSIPKIPNKHKSPWRHVLTATYIVAVLAIPAYAGQITGLHIFQSGQPAKATEVNENFATISDAVNDNHTRISALEATVLDIKNRLANLESNMVTPKNIIISNTIKYTVPQGKALYIHTIYSQANEKAEPKFNNQSYAGGIGPGGLTLFPQPLIVQGGAEISVSFSNNGTGELRITGYEK